MTRVVSLTVAAVRNLAASRSAPRFETSR
jgi:hypothetical protein